VFVCLRVRARDRIKRQAAGGRSVPCSLSRSLAPDRMGARVDANVPRCLAGIGQQRCRDTGLLLHGRLQARIVGRICGRTGINAEPTPCPGPANTMIAPTVVVTPRRFRHARHMQADGGAPAGCKGGRRVHVDQGQGADSHDTPRRAAEVMMRWAWQQQMLSSVRIKIFFFSAVQTAVRRDNICWWQRDEMGRTAYLAPKTETRTPSESRREI